MKIHPLIKTTNELSARVTRMSAHDFVVVDTEFMRENTSWPDLCLLQIATEEEAAAIDPKAEGIDLAPLLELLVAAIQAYVFALLTSLYLNDAINLH